MSVGINPLIDYAFKMLFGSDDRKMLTVHFLNAVLVRQPPVTDVTFPNTVHSKLSEDGKFFILDVLSEEVLGRKFNIEVQIALPAGMAERMVFYTAETYVRRLQQGQILLLQRLLKLPTCTDERFAACDIDQLAQMLTQLQQQIKNQVP